MRLQFMYFNITPHFEAETSMERNTRLLSRLLSGLAANLCFTSTFTIQLHAVLHEH